MSRLIVKSLPSHCTEASLRTFFKKYGTLTDCTLKYTKEGKFRKFAFVGFDSEEVAQKAQEETNQSFMGSARLQVEECRPFGDSNKPRAWSQYSKDSSAFKRKQGTTTQSESAEDSNVTSSTEPEKKKKKGDNEDFDKFLEAKGVDTSKEPDIEIKEASVEDKKLLKELMEGITGDTKLSLLFTGLPSSIKQKSMKDWLSPVRVKAMKIVRNDSSAAAFVTFNRPPDVRRALQRDGEFIGGYKVHIEKIEEKEEDIVESYRKEATQADNDDIAGDRSTEEAKVLEEILDTGRLFIRNLPFSTKEDDLRFLFKPFGELSDVQVIINKTTGQCKGFGIVEFVFPESAVAAYAAHDGKVFKGRMLHIIAGAEKRETQTTEKEGAEGAESRGKGEEKSSFKKEKMAKLKANAGKSHSWNALFLGPNAIADTLAEKLGIEKKDLLLGEGGESAGVRMALAETRLVREMRDFLVENGVQLDAFSRPAAKRSDTVMLAKNLPSGVEAAELERMFGKFGQVDKVIMPPEGGISALIVMGNTVDAKKAFKALAYSRFRTQPLYLEWAPGDVFGAQKEEEGEKNKESTADEGEKAETSAAPVVKKNKRDMTYEERMAERKRKRGEIVEEKKSAQTTKKEEEEEKPETERQPEEKTEDVLPAEAEVSEEQKEAPEEGFEPGSTVFVKNLAFDTTDESLSQLFSKRFRIKSAQVSKKLNPADPSKSLSMGFGFVQFWTQEGAQEAMKVLQGELLDGHCLELKISHREVIDKDSLKRKDISHKKQGKNTKLLVRNLPFQAKIKEIENLFSSFGEIRNIRIPKKMGSRDEHRGFGFVDFMSVGEAARAFDSLVHSTHLYGRRLVLEWAKEDESVDELRQKTANKFSGEKKELKKQKDRIEAIEKDLAKTEDDE